MTGVTLPTDFSQFLVYLGTPAFIGFALSYVAAHWAWYNSGKLSEQGRMLILFLLSFGLGIGSHFLVAFVPASADSVIQPYYDIFLQSLTILMASQVYYHKVIVPAKIEQARLASIPVPAKG